MMPEEKKIVSKSKFIEMVNEKINGSNLVRIRDCRVIDVEYNDIGVLKETKFDGDCTDFVRDEINKDIVAVLSGSFLIRD